MNLGFTFHPVNIHHESCTDIIFIATLIGGYLFIILVLNHRQPNLIRETKVQKSKTALYLANTNYICRIKRDRDEMRAPTCPLEPLILQSGLKKSLSKLLVNCCVP